MRSALQMLGGVAVAGVVATGSTAFTASGVTNSISTATFLGGSVTQNVDGATLSAMTLTNSTPNQVTAVVLTLTSDTNALITAAGTSIAISGDASHATGPITCTGTSAHAATITCAPASGYYTAITGITVTVV